MTAAQIIARTGRVYEIFKLTVQLNEYRFKDMDLDEVIEELIEFAGVDPSYIARQELVKRITAYCDEYDTGIYY